MNVSAHTTQDMERLEAVFRLYDAGIQAGTIQPELIDQFEMHEIKDDDVLLVAKDERNPMLGILHYTSIRPRDTTELGSILSSAVSIVAS